MTNKKWTCPECEETFEKDSVYTRQNLRGEDVCESCYYNATSYATKLFRFLPSGEKQISLFDADFVFSDEQNDDTENYPVPIKAQKYIQTDGWRGYTDCELLPDYIEFVSGWVTGHPDDTTKRKADLNDYFSELNNGELKPPCDIYWIFGHTSNVFSTSSSIFVHKDNEKKLEKWLNKINGGREDFQNKFN